MSGAATVRGWAKDVKRFADDWPRQGGDVLKRAVDAELRGDTGGDGAMGTLGRASVEVTARPAEADVVGAGSRAVWAILEGGTRAHTVTGKGPRGLLRTPYGPRRRVNVSGAPAKRTWSRGVERGMAAVEADAERAWGGVG